MTRNSSKGLRGSRAIQCWTCVTAALLVSGCGKPPQVHHDNRRLIESLRTAVSTQKVAWLDQNASLVEQRNAVGKLTDEEYAEFSGIIAKARQGDWSSAESRLVVLAKAQQPTAEDLENLKQRKTHPDAATPPRSADKRRREHAAIGDQSSSKASPKNL